MILFEIFAFTEEHESLTTIADQVHPVIRMRKDKIPVEKNLADKLFQDVDERIKQFTMDWILGRISLVEIPKSYKRKDDSAQGNNF
jgi:hypothetical protein